MSHERSEDTSDQSAVTMRQAPDDSRDRGAAPQNQGPAILVRGETVKDGDSKSPGKNSPPKEVWEAKVNKQGRLPALDDDADLGVEKNHVVTRDGKADLAFTGKLVASAAPLSAPKGKWWEYRVYETTSGKHVFSKVTRTVFVGEQDEHEAEVFDPSPSTTTSALLRSARDLTRSKPLEWTDAATAFFGYDPLAKALYRKLSGQFEEHIS